MTVSLHQEILGNLWRGHNPYYGFPYKTVKPDLQGWASQHRFLMETVATRRPKIVVEVGVWKGASVIELAQSVRANGLDAVVIAVDTWLGAWDHWTNDQWHGELGFEFGFPTIYRTFLANVITAGLQDIVIPLPLDSVNAQHTLKGFEIFPDLVHIDGARDSRCPSKCAHVSRTRQIHRIRGGATQMPLRQMYGGGDHARFSRRAGL